ncbi:unknown protein [Seminavis robusta]|uniref:Uncharacterized protein n=1 Tax=Seminavis robusta TaxID=568900 RepID=A0A9N8EA27_9STRA|nr:unknown protein [Seminavis robusta]|eukprot:Sro795_g203590.1 n/a (151) ;mRNA; r:37598-38050
MEASKAEKREAQQRQEIALQVLEQAENNASAESFTNAQLRHLLCWKMGSKTIPGALKNKPEKVAKWMQLKNKEPPSFEPWSEADEEELIQLKEKIDGDIALGDTSYGRQRANEVNKARSLLRGLSKADKEAFLKSLEEDNGDDDAGSDSE